MTSLFSTCRRVEFAETDMAGIVHFANFFRYLEEAEHELFRSLGTSILHKESDGTILSWPRVEASCRFEAPAFHEDLLQIHLTELNIGRASLTMSWEIFREKTRLCSGTLKTVFCCIAPGQRPVSQDIPPGIRAKLEAVARGGDSATSPKNAEENAS